MTEQEHHARVIATLLRAIHVQARMSALSLEALVKLGLPRDAATYLLKDAANGFENCPDPETGNELAQMWRTLAGQSANG